MISGTFLNHGALDSRASLRPAQGGKGGKGLSIPPGARYLQLRLEVPLRPRHRIRPLMCGLTRMWQSSRDVLVIVPSWAKLGRHAAPA